jgi:hypothetical protein
MIKQAQITRHWSRIPGKFLTPDGRVFNEISTSKIQFEGSVREWYETLIETIRDVVIAVGETRVWVSPKTRVLVEASFAFCPAIELDGMTFTSKRGSETTLIPVENDAIGVIDNMTFFERQSIDDNDVLIIVNDERGSRLGQVIIHDYNLE